MTSPISDILSKYEEHLGLHPHPPRIAQAEQALTALLEAAMSDNDSTDLSPAWLAARANLRKQIRAKLGIPTEPKDISQPKSQQ